MTDCNRCIYWQWFGDPDATSNVGLCENKASPKFDQSTQSINDGCDEIELSLDDPDMQTDCFTCIHFDFFSPKNALGYCHHPKSCKSGMRNDHVRDGCEKHTTATSFLALGFNFQLEAVIKT